MTEDSIKAWGKWREEAIGGHDFDPRYDCDMASFIAGYDAAQQRISELECELSRYTTVEKTHCSDCYKWHGHEACAARKVGELEAELRNATRPVSEELIKAVEAVLYHEGGEWTDDEERVGDQCYCAYTSIYTNSILQCNWCRLRDALTRESAAQPSPSEQAIKAMEEAEKALESIGVYDKTDGHYPHSDSDC